MTFNKLVAVIAISTLAIQANAYSDGTLRRAVTVAQNDTTVITESEPAQGVVIMNSNTNTNSASAAAVQPVTIVEAAPVADSKAELMRKARQSEEVKTEQKIVEKLEESRLREEQQRAERLFGDRIEAPAAAATATAVATPNSAAASATAIVSEPVEAKPVTPTQVTIERVEIVQPAAPMREERYEPAAPVAVSRMDIEEEKEEGRDRLFVGAILGAPNYSASNVKSNFGLGVSVGTILKTDWVLEGSFLFSNHSVDTYWQYPLYRDLDQYDFSIAAKYYILSGRLKPYLGGSATYIYRKYQDRSQYGDAWNANPNSTEEDTHAVNAGLTAGVDFALNDNILLGAGLDYNFNLMNRQDFQAQYSIPSGVKALEEIDYTVIKINAKMTF